MWIAHLKIPLPNCAAPSAVSIVEVAERYDERKGEPEARDDGGCAREPAVVPREPLDRPEDEEGDREDVGEADRARDVPVDLLERDAEDRREEEKAGDSHSDAPQQLGQLLDARSPAPAGASSRGSSGVPSRSPARQRACSPSSASRIAGHVVGRRRRRRRPSRGSGPQPRRPGARPPGSAARRRGTRTPCPRGRRARGRTPRGSGAGAPRSRAGARASGARDVRDQLEPVAEPERLGPFARRPDGSRRRTGRRTSRPDSASAVRNGRGSRLPKKLPACVIRKRSDGPMLEPGEVVEVASRSRSSTTRPAGSSARASSAIASAAADDRVRVPAPRARRSRARPAP